MRFSFWQSVRKLVAAGFVGISVTAAQAYGGPPAQLSSFDEADYSYGESPAISEMYTSAVAHDSTGNSYQSAGGCDDDCDCIGNWRDNTYVWFGGDAYKSLVDSGIGGFAPNPFAIGNSFGLVGGFNTGFALGESRVRGQIGGSFGAYDFKGRTFSPKDDSLQQQTYATIGLYKRGDISDCDRISWGLVYDALLDHQAGWAANEIFLGQIRYRVGYAINECNEFGVWGTLQTHDDDNVDLSFPIAPPQNTVRAMNQLNGYWNHNWAFGATTMGYLGIFDPADLASWQFGLLNVAPVSDHLSVYANFNYVAPSSATGPVGAGEEQWNVSVGFVYYFGGKAVANTISGQQGLPLMPVANNGNFLITN